MIQSKALLFEDFESDWYKKWARQLKQTQTGRGKFKLRANKFWQNAAMAQALHERGALEPGKQGIGFGVGKERLPALFAGMDVKVLATDQDFKTSKAAEWDNDQLSHGRHSLNMEKICSPRLFTRNVRYQAVDMKKIPKNLNGNFDFLWSNCALGHLGSIDAGLEFIEKSLACLKAGGWAVHTTEANIISNDETLDNAGTVFFRQRDLLSLASRLTRKGYLVEPLHFRLYRDSRDLQFTLSPEWGSDHSKILFDGHMATQILLIIHRPVKALSTAQIKRELIKHRRRYYMNLATIRRYKKRNKHLAALLKHAEAARHTDAKSTRIAPRRLKPLHVKLAAGQSATVRLPYRNDSKAGLFRLHASFSGVAPLAVATYRPVNRNSKFAGKNWLSKNRPQINFVSTASKATEYIKPHSDFAIEFQISANGVKPGEYKEWVGLVREGDDIISGTEIELRLTVTKP